MINTIITRHSDSTKQLSSFRENKTKQNTPTRFSTSTYIKSELLQLGMGTLLFWGACYLEWSRMPPCRGSLVLGDSSTLWSALSESAQCCVPVHCATAVTVRAPKSLSHLMLEPGLSAGSFHSCHLSATQYARAMYSSNAYWLKLLGFFFFF